MMKKILVTFLCVLIITMGRSQTQRIEFEAPAAYPEGIAYDAINDLFYVSSVHTGTIGKVDRNGSYTAVFADTMMKSSFGMKIMAAKHQLWFCVGDPNFSRYRDPSTYRKMIRLIGLDLATNKKIADIDLSTLYNGRHFANDLTMDQSGNIFITDSFSPVIYKVDSAGKASVLTQHMLFGATGTGLNGIVWHPSNFLLTVNNANGAILKVNLANKEVTKVKVNQFFPGADGLLIDEQGNLVLVQNKGVNKVFKLSSPDEWKTAGVIAATESKAMFSFPSTATFSNSEVWVMNAKLHELSDSSTVFSNKFSLQLAEFVPVK